MSGGAKLDQRGTIYAFLADTLGMVKIGFTNEPTVRLIQARISCPVPLFMAAALEGTARDERDLQRRFASSRVHGEWFRVTPEIADWMRSHAIEPTVTRRFPAAANVGRRTQYDARGRWPGFVEHS
jgi:hypothetical protein